MPIQLSVTDRQELECRARSRVLRAEDVRRAKVLLMLGDGESYRSIQAAVGCSSAYVSRWKERYEADGLAGLYGRHRGRKVTVLTPAMEARILSLTRQAPPDVARLTGARASWPKCWACSTRSSRAHGTRGDNTSRRSSAARTYPTT
jgi:transposase